MKSKKILKDWIPASKTRNFALNDPLLDYLRHYNINDINDKPKKFNLKSKIIKSKNSIKKKGKKILNKIINFENYILNEGISFENDIYSKLKNKFNNNIVKICDAYEARDIKYYNKTLEEIKKGTKIIYQGVVCDFENKVFGVPDLIVRSDVINSIFDNIIISRSEQRINAPLIGANNYHYRIIDIKNSLLHLNVDKLTIRNTINIKPFKTQIYIYNECLSKMQGYNSNISYILGNGWITSKQVNKQIIQYKSLDPFNKAGIINFKDTDSEYKFISEDAIHWLKKLYNSKKWKLDPLKNKYLYPNMNNNLDGKYRKIKIQLANKIGEITNLWNCSINNRDNAFSHKIFSWRDVNCNSDSLGIKGKYKNIIDDMIKFHRNDLLIQLPKEIPNTRNWKDLNNLSFYVDFETINNSINNETIIFMIGLGWDINNKWYYKNYTIKSLNNNEEERILDLFTKDLKLISNKYNSNNPNVYHWSSAEKTIFNKANNKYNNKFEVPNWFDFLNIFKDNNILIKDCFDFGLKNIAKSMYKYKFINTTWDGNVCDGLDAMVLAFNEYQKNIDINTNQIINNIIKYNEIDCKVIWDIIKFLKTT